MEYQWSELEWGIRTRAYKISPVFSNLFSSKQKKTALFSSLWLAVMERHQLYYSLLLRFFLPPLLFSRDMVIDDFEYLQLTVRQNGWGFRFFVWYSWSAKKCSDFTAEHRCEPIKRNTDGKWAWGIKAFHWVTFGLFLLFLGDFCVTPWQMENAISTLWATFLIQQLHSIEQNVEHLKELLKAGESV